MRRAALLAAILLVLLAVACGTKARAHENAQDEATSVANLRASLPAIEAYKQDHNAYTGMTPVELHDYDSQIANISIVSARKQTYCIEATGGDSRVFKNGPAAGIMLGTCDDSSNGVPVDSSSADDSSIYTESLDALGSIRASIPAIEAYDQDHNGYSGMTLSKLHQIDYGLPEIKIVSAKKRSYCIEINVKGASAFTQGPMGKIETGTCPR